jgi:uncharacterized protein
VTTLLVIAKAPVAGRSKTRLCPPCTPEQAAELAEAALVDTLEAVLATDADRRVIVLDGEPGPWLPDGFEVVPQRAGGLADRLRGGFEDAGTGGFLVGMDTPQVDVALLTAALAATAAHGSALGRTGDGGWWGIGLPGPEAAVVFDGVPMSSVFTGDFQAASMLRHGLRPAPLPLLRDVDTFTDAEIGAALTPDGRFAAGVRRVATD